MLNLCEPVATHNSSSNRVQSWLDSMYYHHSSFDEETTNVSDEKSSLASNISIQSTKMSTKMSTKNSKNSIKKSSRKSISTSSSSSVTNRNVRRIYLRKPRYLIRRFKKKTDQNTKKSFNNSIDPDTDQTTSYFSAYNSSSADESTLFSNSMTGLNFLTNDDSNSKKLADIRADDLEFESRDSFVSSSNSSSLMNCSNYSSNNHVFGVLDFENFETNLQLNDDLRFKVKTYAFSQKDIKIKVKDNTLVVIGKQQIEEDDAWFKREFRKKFDLPTNADKNNIKCDFTNNDYLTITVPRIRSVHWGLLGTSWFSVLFNGSDCWS